MCLRPLCGSETYLNCLDGESTRARAAYRTVLDRYIGYFGLEAGVECDDAD